MEETRCLVCHPAVCCVGREYEIILLCNRNALASVTVAGVTYTDNNNGVMRTDTPVHKIKVPGKALDTARQYTVNLAPLADHCNYYPKPEPTQTYTYAFYPVPQDTDLPVQMYVLADTHGDGNTPARAATALSGNQLLILDGDIGDSADTEDMITTMHRLASAVTGGTRPVIYARGNHDTRGHRAERLTDYVPTREGATFYSFRQGPVWGVVLDAGEDKPDASIEYGGVCDFPGFRQAQTAYLSSLIQNKEQEYEAEGVRYRIAICHMPFIDSRYAFSKTTPEIYAQWVSLLNRIGIQVLLCGHNHCLDELGAAVYEGAEKPSFPTLLCAAMAAHPGRGQETWIPGQYTGTCVVLRDGVITHTFTNQDGEIVTI
jgi:hypothetical protein